MDRDLTGTERALGSLWSEVLGITQLPCADDNFFSFGGDSMSMAMLEYRINEEFSIDLPPGAVLEAETLRDLGAVVDEYRARGRQSE